MRATDTNVLVRLLVRDDESQAKRAEAFVADGVWVSVLALAETAWVLDRGYGRSPAQIAAAMEMLLNHASIVVQDADAVESALRIFRAAPTLGFSDCLMLALARKAGHSPLGTFDRKLGAQPGAVRI